MNHHVLLLLCTCFLLQICYQHTGYAAETTNSCHCFRNRTFNPADRFASDDYLLATTFNSLLAGEFEISKGRIIMMKMREGVAGDDLVAALYLSRESGMEVSQLLQLKKTHSWQEIVDSMMTGRTESDKKDRLCFITSGSSEKQLTDCITDSIIADRFGAQPDSLDEQKKKNLQSREIILVYALSDIAGIPAKAIVDQRLHNGLSWSEIAHNLGLQPSDVGTILEEEQSGKRKDPSPKGPALVAP